MKKISFIFLFCVLIGGKGYGQWLNVYLSQTSAVHFPSGNVGYMGFGSDIKKTTDGGNTWKILRTGIPATSQSMPVYIQKIQFLSNTVGYIGSNNNQFLLKTSDGGQTWDFLSTPPGFQAAFNYITFQFINESIGYRTSNGKVYKTTDGGLSWVSLAVQSNGEYFINNLSFIDDQRGRLFAFKSDFVTAGVKMYTTIDGGATWSERNVPYLYQTLTAQFISSTVGFVAGSRATNTSAGAILKTIDGGLSWTETIFSRPISKLEFFDNNFGVAVGSSSATSSLILVTTDGGTTWETKEDLSSGNGSGVELKDVDVLDAATFVTAGGYNQNIYKSTNGGTTINRIAASPLYGTNYRNKLFAVNSDIIYASTQEQIPPTGPVPTTVRNFYKTIDGGQNWTSVSRPDGATGYGTIWFASETVGYGGTANGEIAKTIDGGQTWTTQTTGLAGEIRDIKFVGTTGYAVASDGKVLKTTNGTSWTAQTTPVSTILKSIHVFDATHAIVVGQNGVILKTVNGTSWTSVTSPTTLDLNSIHFPTSSIGYAVGANGKIIKSTNGGDTWTSLQSSSSGPLYTVTFYDQSFGYAAGDMTTNGGILVTSDGGVSWNRQTVTGIGPGYVESIVITSSTTAVAMGTGQMLVAACSNPSFFATPQGQSLNTGETIVLASNVGGVGTINYTWKKDGTDLGVNNPTLTISNAQVSHTGVYSLTVNDACGTSSATGITVNVFSSEPGNQPTTFKIESATSTTASFTFTPPSPAPSGYLVIRKTASQPNENPVDGTVYTTGATLGTSTIAYVGTDPSFTDTGLTTQTTYHYAVFAYSGSGMSTNYRISAPLRGTSLETAPTSKPGNFRLTGFESALTFAYTASADADGYIVLRSTNASSTDVPVNTISYTKGASIGQSVVAFIGDKDDLTFTETALPDGFVYYYNVMPFRGSGLSTNYLTDEPAQTTSLANEPENHVSNISFSNIRATTATLIFTPALGNPTGYIILRKKGSASSAIPADGTVYQANEELGDALVISSGSFNSSQTDLEPGTQYYYSIYAFNGVNASTNYLTAPSINNLGVLRTLSMGPEVIPAINVLFNSFTARWNPVIGANSYKLDVSTDENFLTFVDNFHNRETNFLVESVDNLKTNTTYHYRVRAVNSSGDSEYSETMDVTTADVPAGTVRLQLSSPTFSSAFPSDEQSQKISVIASNGIGSRKAKFYHKGVSGTTFTSFVVPPSASNTNMFEITITRDMLDEIGIECYIAVEDAAYTEVTPNFIIRKVYSATNSPSLPVTRFGGKEDTYTMVSFPLSIEDNSVKTIFESVLGGYDDTKWRLVRYQNGAYVDYPTFDKIELGKSYWFNAKDQVTIKAGVSSTPKVDAQTQFKMALGIGWNQIATPFPFAIDWRDVLSDNNNPDGVGNYRIFIPNTLGFAESNSLEPYSGGFVFSEKAIELDLPVTLKNGSARRANENEISSDIGQPDWQLPVTLSQGQVVNELGAIGMNTGANFSKDKFDDITLPRFGKFLEFNNYHHEYLAPRFTKDIVPTSGEYQWDLVVESSFGDGDITMTWDNTDMGTSNAQLLLFHPGSGTLLNMKDVSSFTFPNRNRNEFRVLYSSDPSEKISGTTMMGVAYPNPSSGQFNFKLLTDGQSSTQLEIFDLLGRRVYTQQQEATGLVSNMSWPAVDSHGIKLQAGIYIYKVRTAGTGTNFRKEGKLILH